MPLVNFHLSHFRSRAPNGHLELDIAWDELVHAAITVGKWRDDFFAHGRYSGFEAKYRANLLWAYLRQSGSGRYIRTAAYDDLDATEKSGVSYALGVTLAKAFATRELSVPWLMHLDRYRVVFGVRLRPGRSRPDLVGPQDVDTLSHWLVAEAKGRTHDLDSQAVMTMRAQKRRVLTVAGRRPFLYIGAAAHFTSGVLECRVVDPRASGRRHELFVDIDDAKRGFVRAYYRPVLDLLEEGGISDGRHVLRALPDADLTLGMSVARRDALRRYVQGDLEDISLEPGAFGDERADTASVGDDGILVKLGPSWSDEAMMSEPRDRPSADQRA